jgi:hypothetical protein
MEIRHSPIPLHTPLPPTQQPARTPAQQEVTSTTGLRQERRDGGLTEYIARGELVEENDSTDYRELIRAARQQRVEALHTEPGAGGDASPYAARALSAYQANAGDPAAAGTHQGLDELV